MKRIMRENLRDMEVQSNSSIIQLVAVTGGEKRENGGDGNHRKGYRVKFSRMEER